MIADESCKPFEPSEWSRLAEKMMQAGLQPKDLPDLTDADYLDLEIDSAEGQRIRQLIRRGANLTFELEKYENLGISVVTRADKQYPSILKTRLGKSCPPLFYYAGDLSLAAKQSIGFVGSRGADEGDQAFTEQIVNTVNGLNYSVVSGGAKGVDSIAGDASLRNEHTSVAYLADSMVKRIRNRETIAAIQCGKLLLLSAVRPDMGFTAATAMMRNRYIYAQSAGAVIVRADYKKGGTWTGAVDCIKHKICPAFCWNNQEYRGNRELIQLGAVPIDADWDGDVTNVPPPAEEEVQLTLFG
ncbi:MAG: DNA-protecting protein DprA [Oscillospiraceae bacterium]|nr:DNA-protecting protein DprA [Oscillospiraceae bacterium]